jgi:hypothetical protein
VSTVRERTINPEAPSAAAEQSDQADQLLTAQVTCSRTATLATRAFCSAESVSTGSITAEPAPANADATTSAGTSAATGVATTAAVDAVLPVP